MTTPVQQPQKPDPDPYDLGEDASSTPPAGTEEAADSPPSSRPRGPDGKFLKRSDHPDRLVRLAKDLGFSEDEIAQMPTPTLREWVNDAATERMLQRRETVYEQAREQAAVPQAPEPASQPAPEPPQPSEAFDWDMLDQDLAKFLKGQQARIDALEKRLADYDEVRGHVQATVNRTTTEQIDAEFAKRPDLFGKGGYADIKQGSPEMMRRSAVVEIARTIKDGTIGERIAKAISIVYPTAPKPESPAPAPSEEIERWREGGLALPTQRQGAGEPPGPQKAKQTVRQYFQENGRTDSPGIADEFPG